ncbi:hypothetical protein DN441_00180 [Lactobacillus reuteri]|nr:hypothetical protein [Limosilactobacillus reuteri]
MINYKCFGKVRPCLFVAESIGKDGEIYYLNVNVKRRAYSRIKRTRKRQIAKAKHMMAWHDHTSYEWSQWWHSKARKPKRWKK